MGGRVNMPDDSYKSHVTLESLTVYGSLNCQWQTWT